MVQRSGRKLPRHRAPCGCGQTDRQPGARSRFRALRRGGCVFRGAQSASGTQPFPRALAFADRVRPGPQAPALPQRDPGRKGRNDAARLRCQRFARASYAAYGAFGIPGNGAGTRPGSGTHAKIHGAHGRAGRAHAAHHRGPARALGARIRARTGAGRACSNRAAARAHPRAGGGAFGRATPDLVADGRRFRPRGCGIRTEQCIRQPGRQCSQLHTDRG